MNPTIDTQTLFIYKSALGLSIYTPFFTTTSINTDDVLIDDFDPSCDPAEQLDDHFTTAEGFQEVLFSRKSYGDERVA